MKVTALAPLLALLCACALPSAGGGPTGAEADVVRLEERRFAAMVARDTAELGRILADDLTYTHSTGVEESKGEFLRGLAGGTLVYEGIEPAEARVRVYGAAAVVTGTARMRVRTPAGAQAFRIRYTDVYALREGRWRMVAWQSTRLPD